MNELLDLETLVKVKRAAPQVTVVPFDLACWVVRGMAKFSEENKGTVDPQGQVYWTTTVKSLHEYCRFDFEVSLNTLGRTLKALGLESWRKMDGFHIAWSWAQFEILRSHFKIG